MHTFEIIVYVQLELLKFLGYGGYSLPHVNNLNVPENMIALLFLHTIEDNFEKQKRHKMEELSIPRKHFFFNFEKSITALSRITVKYLHFAMVLWKPKFFDIFQNKPYMNNFFVTRVYVVKVLNGHI